MSRRKNVVPGRLRPHQQVKRPGVDDPDPFNWRRQLIQRVAQATGRDWEALWLKYEEKFDRYRHEHKRDLRVARCRAYIEVYEETMAELMREDMARDGLLQA